MQRLYSDFAYGDAPRSTCWWDETCAAPHWQRVQQDMAVEVAVIGGGFTGVSTALHLAQAGVEVALLEAREPGWGASGRNGGFCCIGGAKLGARAMERRFGSRETQTYQAGEVAAVQLAADLIARHGIDADTHSAGETVMAHSARIRETFRREAEAAPAGEMEFIDGPDLAAAGLNGEFHAALTTHVGFALNPRKYLFGLASAALSAGARLFQNSPAQRIVKLASGGWQIETPGGLIKARKLVIATNGYSSEDLPDWLAGRYMPTQSTVLVTRPLSDAEQAAQGWTSSQMAYDSRNLLHYFRLMPDGRFLFGMRGGLLASAGAERRIRDKLVRDFRQLFPAWSHVEISHCWSGMVCLARDLTPFVGKAAEVPDLYAGLCYHGNGVAMGTYAGRLLGDIVRGTDPDLPYSPVMKALPKFPLGRARRLLLPPAYAILGLLD